MFDLKYESLKDQISYGEKIEIRKIPEKASHSLRVLTDPN